MEIRNALSKLKMFCFKLAIVTENDSKQKTNFVIYVKLKMRLISFFNAKIIRTSRRDWFIFSSLMMMMMMMMMMMINCFCGMVDLQKEFSLIFSQDHCQRSWPLWISDMPRAGFEPAHNLNSGLVEWNCVIVITTTPRCYSTISTGNINLTFGNKLEKLKLLFVSGSWGSLNACAKLVLKAYKKREQNPTR